MTRLEWVMVLVAKNRMVLFHSQPVGFISQWILIRPRHRCRPFIRNVAALWMQRYFQITCGSCLLISISVWILILLISCIWSEYMISECFHFSNLMSCNLPVSVYFSACARTPGERLHDSMACRDDGTWCVSNVSLFIGSQFHVHSSSYPILLNNLVCIVYIIPR